MTTNRQIEIAKQFGEMLRDHLDRFKKGDDVDISRLISLMNQLMEVRDISEEISTNLKLLQQNDTNNLRIALVGQLEKLLIKRSAIDKLLDELRLKNNNEVILFASPAVDTIQAYLNTIKRSAQSVNVDVTPPPNLIAQLKKERNDVGTFLRNIINEFTIQTKLAEANNAPLRRSKNRELIFLLSKFKSTIYAEISESLEDRLKRFEREHKGLLKTNAFIVFITEINNLNYVELHKNKRFKDEIISFFENKELSIDELRYLINQLIKSNILPTLCSDAESFETLKTTYLEALLSKLFSKYPILDKIYSPEDNKPNDIHAIEQIGYLINDYNRKKQQSARGELKAPLNSQSYKDEIRLTIDALKGSDLDNFIKNKSVSNVLEKHINDVGLNLNVSELSIESKKNQLKLAFYNEIDNKFGINVTRAIKKLLNTPLIELNNIDPEVFKFNLKNFIQKLNPQELEAFSNILTQEKIVSNIISNQETDKIKKDLSSILNQLIDEKFFTSRENIFNFLQNKYSGNKNEIAVIRQIKSRVQLEDFIVEKFKCGDFSVKDLVHIYKLLPSTDHRKIEDPIKTILGFANNNIWQKKLHANFFQREMPTGISKLRTLGSKIDPDFDDILNAINYSSYKSKFYNLTGIRDSMTKEFYELIIEINELRHEQGNQACIQSLLMVFKSKYNLKTESSEDLVMRIFSGPSQ